LSIQIILKATFKMKANYTCELECVSYLFDDSLFDWIKLSHLLDFSSYDTIVIEVKSYHSLTMIDYH